MALTMDEFRALKPARDTFALFGDPIGHTMSPTLHSMLFDASGKQADYIAVRVPPADLPEALALAKEKLCGVNLTIPHKKAILPLLDAVDQSAADLSSVNTVAFRHGKAIGYNTDILGFAASLEKDGIALAGKKAVLLGYGGAAAVMGYHCVHEGAALFITGRNLEKAEAPRQHLLSCFPEAQIEVCTRRRIPKDTQIVVNGTPLGMTPREEQKPLYFLPHKTEYVFDAIYNPPMTALLKLANPRRTVTRDGLYMLVMQAAYAQTVWLGTNFNDAQCTPILRRLYGQLMRKRLTEIYGKRNIALCGFMGAGKTTVGKKIARICAMEFIDADHYLEAREGRTIADIFAAEGEAGFRKLETHYLRELSEKENCIIALGGGAVMRPENVEAVKTSAVLVHLDTPLSRITKNLSYSNHRPLLAQAEDKNAEIRRLYNARKDFYRNAADKSVRAVKVTTMAEQIIKSI